MKFKDVYNKEYKCSKCNDVIYYAKITDENGTVITKDGNAPNGLFGKAANTLSASVNADKKELHGCYLSLVQKQYQDAIGLQANRPETSSLSTSTSTSFDEFTTVANTAYMKLTVLASKFCGAGASAKDIHITTMGLMHDYFSFLNSKN